MTKEKKPIEWEENGKRVVRDQRTYEEFHQEIEKKETHKGKLLIAVLRAMFGGNK